MYLPFDANWITERLMAGSAPLTSVDVEVLASLGITHVLDLRERHEWIRHGDTAVVDIAARGLVRLNLAVPDTTAPPLETLDAAVAFVDEALAQPGARVFVHCLAGMERTACVLIAWHARTHGSDYDAALTSLLERRDVLEPTPTQEQTTREWIRTRVTDRSD